MANSFTDLIVYQKAFDFAMAVFGLTRTFPKEEKYSLIDQIRRSSRSVAACIAEAYRKRQYESYFVSKISDADMENTETRVWLQFALRCEYIDSKKFEQLDLKLQDIGRILNHMINFPQKFQRNTSK